MTVGEKVRLISARKATRGERKDYEDGNFPDETGSVDVTGARKQDAFRRSGGGDRRIESEYADARRSISPTQVNASCEVQGGAAPTCATAAARLTSACRRAMPR